MFGLNKTYTQNDLACNGRNTFIEVKPRRNRRHNNHRTVTTLTRNWLGIPTSLNMLINDKIRSEWNGQNS